MPHICHQGNIKTVLITAAIILMSAIRSFAYSFMPLVTCYSMQENSCSTQAWDATQDNDGNFYFATSDGLLVYDGVRWETYHIPGVTTVRSVFAQDDRIYIGAYQQFGYFMRDQCGLLRYTSLNPLVSGYEFRDDEFWSIIPFGGKIYFQSFRSIFSYDGSAVTTYCNNDATPLNLFEVDGHLYSQLIYKGLAEFSGNDYSVILPRTAVGDDIVAILPADDGKTIFCSDTHGLYKGSLTGASAPAKMHTDIDIELNAYSINRAIMTNDGTIVLGTIRNGIYALTPDGHLKWHYNIENGLGNNSVLGLREDKSGNIWVMLDHGIAIVHAGLPYSFLKPHAGEPYIGMTYAIHRDGDRLYVGTNQGLYIYSYTDNKITGNNPVRSQIWHIDKIDNQTLIGGGTLSAVIEGNRISSISTNSSTNITKGIIHNREVLVESSYYVLRIYTKNPADGRWTYSHDVEGFGTPVRQIEIDTDGSLWCSHIAQGVIHAELSPDLRRIVSADTFMQASPESPRSTSFVMKIRGQVTVSDGDSLYSFDRTTNSLRPLVDLHRDLPSIREIYSSTPVDNSLFWLSSRHAYTLVSFKDGHYKRELSIPLDHLTLQSNGVNNRVHVDGNRNCYFAINNGVGFIPLASGIPSPNAEAFMSIASVEHVGKDGTKARLPLNPDSQSDIKIPGNITFRLKYPSYNFGSPKFTYRLDGAESFADISDNPDISFVGLKYGDYCFHAAMLDNDGNTIAQTTYSFTVPKPPYLSYWAMSGYVIAAAALTLAFSKIYTRRQINRQKRDHEIERVAQNVKILEQERIISEQQTQLLQNELALKSKELASMALEAGYKHQVIENLRETITAQRRKGLIDSHEIDSLIKTINSDIGNTEFWNIFQNNFDLIHENFFRNLRQRFPELTPVDMKFCALLRLNMSTKDIAGFTHLTIRGVETARYRLRRKLGLAGNESIVQFLIDFK